MPKQQLNQLTSEMKTRFVLAKTIGEPKTVIRFSSI
jgi:hypothetical protein